MLYNYNTESTTKHSAACNDVDINSTGKSKIEVPRKNQVLTCR